MKYPRIGDVISMRLPNGKFAYAQYLIDDRIGYGQIIAIYNTITDYEIEDINTIKDELMFEPIYVMGMNWAIRNNFWKIIGKRKIFYQGFPKFKQKRSGKWLIWDGINQDNTTYYRGVLVNDLPNEYNNAEELCNYDSRSVENKIVERLS